MEKTLEQIKLKFELGKKIKNQELMAVYEAMEIKDEKQIVESYVKLKTMLEDELPQLEMYMNHKYKQMKKFCTGYDQHMMQAMSEDVKLFKEICELSDDLVDKVLKEMNG